MIQNQGSRTLNLQQACQGLVSDVSTLPITRVGSFIRIFRSAHFANLRMHFFEVLEKPRKRPEIGVFFQKEKIYDNNLTVFTKSRRKELGVAGRDLGVFLSQVMDQSFMIGADPSRGTNSAVAMGRAKKVKLSCDELCLSPGERYS